jgi:hypothetical protein
MALPRLLTHAAGLTAQAAGGLYDQATPGTGTSTLTKAGEAIRDPNRVYTGGYDPLSYTLDKGGQSQFVQAAQPGFAPAGQGGGGQSTGDPAYTGGPNNAAGNGGAADDNALQLGQLGDQEGLLNSYRSRLDTKRGDALTQIGDDYNKLKGRTETDRSNTFNDYATKEADTNQSKLGALGDVDTHARTLSNSVRQLIGRASGSGSSAYQLAAPKAIADKATQERTDVQDTFGRNFRDLDTAKERAKIKFDELLADLEDQRKQKEKGVQEGYQDEQIATQGSLADIARQRAALQGGGLGAIRAASAPFQSDINKRNATIDSLFSQYRTPYNYNAVQADAPQLADYTVDRAAIAPGQAAGDTGASASPYARFLRQDDENKLF